MIERFDNKQDRSRGNQNLLTESAILSAFEVTCTKTGIKLGNLRL